MSRKNRRNRLILASKPIFTGTKEEFKKEFKDNANIIKLARYSGNTKTFYL